MAGDILEVKPGCFLFRHVAACHGGKVSFASRCGSQWLNTTFREPLEEWQEAMREARVLHVGG